MCLNRPVIDQLSSDIQEYIISLEKIVEENNNRDGTVRVPEALRPYMGGKEKLEKCKV